MRKVSQRRHSHRKDKRHPKVAFVLDWLVGDTWIEHVTPAV
jgi:hypothetical protein